MMDYFIDQNKDRVWDRPAPDSKVVYITTQLLERDHCVTLNFNVTAGKEISPRSYFPEQPDPEEDTRDLGIEHLPENTEAKIKSWLKMLAFSQDSPGRSVPAHSNTPQNMVFSIKASTKPKDFQLGQKCLPSKSPSPLAKIHLIFLTI
ncbi:hypothetical protein ACHAP5_012235 [Fusarium lateritium]